MKRRTIWGNDFSLISFVKGVLGEERKVERGTEGFIDIRPKVPKLNLILT